MKSWPILCAFACASLVAGALWLLPSPPAQAQITEASCIFVDTPGATLINFGFYSPGGDAVDESSFINMTCVPALGMLSVGYTMQISEGFSANFAVRGLFDGTRQLGYNLFVDSSRTQVWGDGSAGTVVKTDSCTGVCQVEVHGRIGAGQMVPGGQYSDTVTLTVDF